MSRRLSMQGPFKMTAIALTLLLLFGSLHSGCAQTSDRLGFPSDAQLEQMLRYLVEDGETPGIILGILDADGSTRVVIHGSAGPEARPLGRQSIFELGSINKTFTGTLLALMVQSGEMALEDPVARYLPGHVEVPSRGNREITLLDLATHTSGLPSTPDNYQPVDPQNPWADFNVEALYGFLSSYELTRAPGEQAEYSNLGMGLLGHALSRAAGQEYRTLLRERILEPLGMEATGFTLEGGRAAWAAQGHSAAEVVPFWTAGTAIEGAGGLRSNIEDMLLYLKANVGPHDSELGRAMAFAHTPRREFLEGRDIGLGWRTYYENERAYVQHGGLTGGFSSFIGFDPLNKIGFVLLTNRGRFDDDIGRDFLHYGKPLDIPVVEVPSAVLASYTGEYAYRDDRSMFVRLEEEGCLTTQTPGNQRVRLYAESETSFFAKRHPWRITFDLSEDGEVLGVFSEYLGVVNSGPKVNDEVPPPRTVAGN